MMRLSLMQRVVEGLGQDHRSPLLSAVAAPWGCDPDKVYFWRASANFACVTVVGEQRVLVRFNSVDERNLGHVESEIAILNALAKAGFATNIPLPSLYGRHVEVVDTEWGSFIAVAFTRLAGIHIDSCDMGPEELWTWGAQLAILHNAAEQLPRDLVITRPSFVDILDFVPPFAREDEVSAELQAVRDQLVNLPQNEQNYGLIHFDFETDNLLWQDGAIAVIDFDDCIRMWYAADIVFALRDFFKGKSMNTGDQRFQRFLQGYRSERFIGDHELTHMPVYTRLHRLFFIARLRRCLDIDINNPDLPDWLATLGRKLHRVVEQYIDDIRSGQVICR